MSRAALHARQMLLIHGRQVVGLCGLGSVQTNASRLLQDKYTAAALCGVGRCAVLGPDCSVMDVSTASAICHQQMKHTAWFAS
jgi:hypothetical protein